MTNYGREGGWDKLIVEPWFEPPQYDNRAGDVNFNENMLSNQTDVIINNFFKKELQYGLHAFKMNNFLYLMFCTHLGLLREDII